MIAKLIALCGAATRIPKTRVLKLVAIIAIGCGQSLCSPNSHAQMIQTSTPFNSFSDSFNQRMGVDFGFQLQGGRGPGSRTVGLLPGRNITPNIGFRQNSAAAAIPAFGGFDPNAQATGGFSNVSGGNRFDLGFGFGQGNTRTHTSTTPTVVAQNGTTGSVFSGQLTPFVTGFIPIVGQNPNIRGVSAPRRNHLRDMLRNAPANSSGYSDQELNGSRESEFRGATQSVSSAATGARGVNAIKAERAQKLAAESAAANAEIREFIAKADAYQEAGKTVLARSYYRSALLKMGDDSNYSELQKEIFQRFENLSKQKK